MDMYLRYLYRLSTIGTALLPNLHSARVFGYWFDVHYQGLKDAELNV